jgi:exosortase/archaeosortase family protein
LGDAVAAPSWIAPRTTRSTLFLLAFLLLTINSLAGLVIRAFTEGGAEVALASTFGISAIVWVAVAAGVGLLVGDRESIGEPLKADWPVIVAASLVALLPMANASSVALAGLGLYAAWTSPASSALRRAGIIFAAITANLIWGRLLLGLFSRDLMFIDAFFVSNLFGSEQISNMVSFADRPGWILIAPGCSSLQSVSLALVFWVTVQQYFDVKTSYAAIGWCVLALLSAVAINVARMGAIVHYHDYFDALHTGWAAQAAAYATMLAIVAIVLWGARREVFA